MHIDPTGLLLISAIIWSNMSYDYFRSIYEQKFKSKS
jgi:hypothetical protein